MTADPVDMAELMQGLVDEEGNVSTISHEPREGRESIDTVVLIKSVANMLNDLDDAGDNTESFSIPGTPDSYVNRSCDSGMDASAAKSVDENSFGAIEFIQSVEKSIQAIDQDIEQVHCDVTNSSYGSLAGLLAANDDADTTAGTFMAPMSPPPSTCKVTVPTSILKSTRGVGNKSVSMSARKGVVFGSPKAVEFNKQSPTTNYTPLNRQQAKALFSMAGSTSKMAVEEVEDEVTQDNSRILEEWDRLTNTSCEEGSDESAAEISVSSSASSRRRRSMLQPSLEVDASDDATTTMKLPDNLVDLMAENEDNNKSSVSIASNNVSDHTQELEYDLNSLIRQHEGETTDDNSSAASKSVNNSTHSDPHNTSQRSTYSSTSDRSLGPLPGYEAHQQQSSDIDSSRDSSGKAMTSDHSSLDSTTLSDIKSDESEVSFRYSIGSTGGARPSFLGPFSIGNKFDVSADNITTESHTVNLEGNMDDLLHNVGASPDASAMLNESDYDYPARESLGDQDPTQTLENDLGDVMFNVEDNNDVHAVQSPLSHNTSVAETVFEGDNNNMDTSLAVSFNAVDTSVDAAAIMRRLKQLNGTARNNSLSQCGTPMQGADASRMSFRRRMSKLTTAHNTSVSKRSKLDISTNLPATGGANEVDTSVVDEPHDFIELNDFLAAVGVMKNDDAKESDTLADVLSRILAESSQEVSDTLSETFSELLKAANNESRSQLPTADDLEIMKEVWATVPDQTMHVLVEGCSNNRKQNKQTIHNSVMYCSVLSQRKWVKWEETLLEYINEAVQDKISEVQCMVSAAKEANDLERMKTKKADVPVVEVMSKEEIKAKCQELQSQIRSTRQVIEGNQTRLRQLQDEAGAIQEDKMSKLVSNFNHATGSDMSSAAGTDNHPLLTEQSKYKEQQVGLEQVNDTIRQQISAINRISYCRTTTYSSNSIKVEAILATNVKAVIDFMLKSVDDELLIDHVNVELENNDKSVHSSESQLAIAYFASVLCCDEISAPLSKRTLSTVKYPSDIPSALNYISGYILSLRRLLSWLKVFSTDGWRWSVQGGVIVVYVHSASVQNYALLLPLRSMLSGDIAAISYDCLKLIDRNSDGSVSMTQSCFENEMKTIITMIAKQFNKDSFGSFPAGPLKQTIIKLLSQ
jgi:hypothetical protein